METQRHSPTLQDTWAVRQHWQVLNQPPGEQKLYGGENERSNYYIWSGEDNLPELPHLLASCVSCWLVTFFFHILSIHLAKTLDLLCVCVYISSLAVNNSVHYHYMSSSSRRAGFFFFSLLKLSHSKNCNFCDHTWMHGVDLLWVPSLQSKLVFLILKPGAVQ